MKKRIVSAVMALILCLTLLPTAALAADGAWDGSIATAFAGGSGTENDPYQIDDGAQLAYLASEVNKGQPYENSYFVLTADIDLANHDWTPIGNSFSDVLLEAQTIICLPEILTAKDIPFQHFHRNRKRSAGIRCIWPVWCDRRQNQQLESGRHHNLRYSKERFRLYNRIGRRTRWLCQRSD